MNRNLLFGLLILSIVIFAGCQPTSPTQTSKSPYIGGSQGVVAVFEEMGIYEEGEKMGVVYENQTFPIMVTLRNKGEYTVNKDEVSVLVKGLDLSSFSGIVPGARVSNSEEIEKISDLNPDGGEFTLDFTPGSDDARYTRPISGDVFDIRPLAEIEYYYETQVQVPNVCFEFDPRDTKVCKIEEDKTVFSSAGPLQVKTAREARAGTNKIAVELTVENVGGGSVTLPGKEFDMRYEQFAYEVINDAPGKWKCTSAGKENEGRFSIESGAKTTGSAKTKGKATIRCNLVEPLEDTDHFSAPFNLNIKYKYKTYMLQDLRIKK